MYVSEAVDYKVIICSTWHLYDAIRKNVLTYAHPDNNKKNTRKEINKKHARNTSVMSLYICECDCGKGVSLHHINQSNGGRFGHVNISKT